MKGLPLEDRKANGKLFEGGTEAKTRATETLVWIFIFERARPYFILCKGPPLEDRKVDGIIFFNWDTEAKTRATETLASV